MSIDRMENGAKAAFTILSIVGLIITGAGLILLLLCAHDPGTPADGAPLSTAQTLLRVSPLILLSAVGLLILTIALALRPITLLLFRDTIDARYRFDQLLSNAEQQKKLLEAVREAAALSDASKQVAYRQRDRDALRMAIKEDIEHGEIASAMLLLTEMERRFGYKSEAEELRAQIENSQRSVVDRQVHEAVAHLDEILARFDWSAAQKEVERLLRQLPTHPEVRKLPEHVEAAKDAHKLELLKQWKDAVARDDVDRSVELLRQLDQYLTPSEGEAYKEAARGVFKKKLQQLGVQFALHTHDKNHGEAFRIARQIIEEFPNSRIANELKDRMDILAERANQPAGV